jgi:hypothetical protein
MTLLVAKGFQQEDFANLHPGGKLGKTADASRAADAWRRPGARGPADTSDAGRHLRDVRKGWACRAW